MISVRPCLILLSALAPFAMLGIRVPQGPKSQVDFPKEILPILKAHCASCHGGATPSGALNLGSAEGLLKGGVSGKAVTPGAGAKSLLYLRITGANGMTRMPMGFAPLSAEQIALVKTWIDQGASIKGGGAQHWAYKKPVRPAMPNVKMKTWVRNPIDSFVLSKLEKRIMKPSSEAGKEILLRRVYLDLVGLPPSPAETDAFLNDKRPDAYERVVDRLLASPHYGERQAGLWLDLARYADSNGFEKDANRVAFKYRDWVIEAFNKNKPYDRFVIEQLAGDLLPNPSLDQLVATGFNRNTMFNQEGGVDPAEGLFEVEIDRVATTGTVFLGETVGCARCHDHKYDPLKQVEFYRMLAFYANPDYEPRGEAQVGEQKYYEPEIDVPTPEQAARRTQLTIQIDQLSALLRSRTPEIAAEQSKWEANAKEGVKWTPLHFGKGEAKGGATLSASSDETILVEGPTPSRNTYKISLSVSANAPITGLRLEALPNEKLPNKGPGRAGNGNFLLSKISVKADNKEVKIGPTMADFEQQDFPVSDTLDDKVDSGWGISPQFGKPHEAVFQFESPVPASTKEIEVTLEHEGRYDQHSLGYFRLSTTSDADPASRLTPPDIRFILNTQNRKPGAQARLDEYFMSIVPSLQPQRKQLAKDKKELEKLKSEIPTALVMRDKPGPLSVHRRNRGEYLNKAEEVTPGTPAFLNPYPKNAPANRLGLAQWIVSKDNPMTARVQVNRMWEMCFGRGIVETSENFGTQGSPPVNQELLDWLAVEFMSKNWDMKAIMRMIVTSSAYRQSSDITVPLLQKDPGNELLARGPRFRMEAEMVRDNALAASGLLSKKVGGPSVYPSQPDGVWNTPYNGQQWVTSKGEDLYRRGLYTFTKRTSPYPAFMTFDGTSRETCTVRRIRTNTPLQALTLMNDPAYLTAAKALGVRMMKFANSKQEEKLAYGFRLCTCRKPTKEETQRLAKLVNQLRARYSKDPKSAKAFAGDVDTAVWTMAASVLLNLDETITKE